MSDVLTVGELLAEFMAERVGQTFSEPGTFLGPYPSGAPAIFVDQVAKTGTSAAMVGWVGEDGFGDLILNRLSGDGVHLQPRQQRNFVDRCGFGGSNPNRGLPVFPRHGNVADQ